MLADVADDGLAHLFHGVPSADALRELGGHLGLLLDANLFQSDFVMNALAAEVLVRRIFAVCLVERAGLAGLLVAHCLVKLWHRRLFADAEMARTRLRLDPLARRRDVDHGEVVVFQSALALHAIGAGLLAQALDHVVDVGVGYFDFRLVDLDALVIAQLDLWLDLEFGLVLDRRTFDVRIDVLQLRIADRLDAFVGDGVAETTRQQPAHHFFLNLLGKTRPHDARRHLARTETGKLGVTGELRGHTLGFVGDQISGDLYFHGFFYGG